MKIGSILLAGLLVATIFVITGNTPAKTSFAEEEIREPDRTAAPSASNSAAGDPGQVVIASGNNRFAVWHDSTPGNQDILFRRSLDNGVKWQPVVNLSNNPGSSINAQMVVSGSSVYVVWSQQNKAGTLDDIYFRRSLDDGATWGPRVKTSASGTSDIDFARPQIAASGSFVYITWFDEVSHNAFFRRSMDNGNTWQPIVNLSNSGTVDYFNGIVALAASGSNVFVAWDDFIAHAVLLRSSPNNGGIWVPPINLSKDVGLDVHGPELAAAGSFVYAGWSDINPKTGSFDVFFARSTNNGGTWSPKVNLSNNVGFSGAPQIAFSGVYVFITWADTATATGNFDVLMRRSVNNGGSWQATKNLSNNAGDSSAPQVAISGANVYFVWNDFTPGNADIFMRRSSNNGGTLQPVFHISNNAGDSFNPQVTTVGANVYVIWQDSTPGKNDIMDRRSDNNGSSWRPIQNLSSNSGESELPQIDG